MIKPFVIDSCALMNACHNYNMSSQFFSQVWEAFNELISKGELISTSEVMEELKEDDLSKWAKQHKDCFVPLSREIQDKTSEILKLYPMLIKMKSMGNSNADPFLIATAIIHKGTLVTDESWGDERNGQFKIPNVCKALNVPCITLFQFMKEIMP